MYASLRRAVKEQTITCLLLFESDFIRIEVHQRGLQCDDAHTDKSKFDRSLLVILLCPVCVNLTARISSSRLGIKLYGHSSLGCMTSQGCWTGKA